MTAHPYPYDHPEIIDGFDGSVGWFLDYSPHRTTPVAGAPDSTAPAFLLSVTPNLDNTVNAGYTTFTLVFSEAMNTSVPLSVTFGLEEPYTGKVVDASSGWTNSTTWWGTFAVTKETGDGVNTIRVSGAKADDGFVVPDDTAHQFEIDTSGGLGEVENLRVVAVTDNSIELAWSPSDWDDLIGYHVYRAVAPNQSNPSIEPTVQSFYVLTAKAVAAPATGTVYTGLDSGTAYYFSVLEYGGNPPNDRGEVANPVWDTTGATSPTPTETPTAANMSTMKLY
jgi:hypothetical protein